MATDTFVVRDGKTVAQSFTGKVMPRGLKTRLDAGRPLYARNACHNLSVEARCEQRCVGVRRKLLAYSISVSVALLLARFGSVTPLGTATLAVSEIEPLAKALIVPVALYVILLPEGILTVSLMLPVPVALNPEAPPVCVAV